MTKTNDSKNEKPLAEMTTNELYKELADGFGSVARNMQAVEVAKAELRRRGIDPDAVTA